MIAWFARNDVAANLLLISVVLFGLMSLPRLPLEVFPSFELDVITVNVAVRGGSPEDIERGVATRIEEAVADLSGIDKITSNSFEGSARVIIEVADGVNSRDLLADVKTRVDSINNLPTEAEKPVTSLVEPKSEVISVFVTGDIGMIELRQLADQVKDEIMALPDISQVEISAARAYEMRIEVSQHRLREYGLSLDMLANAISASSLDLSAGNLRSDKGEILISSRGQAYNQGDFENIEVITQDDGTVLRLGDIATVFDDFEEEGRRVLFNGSPSVSLNIFRIGDENAIDIADQVKGYIDLKQYSLPDKVTIGYWDDDSVFIQKRINTLLNNALQGAILVVVLLSLFLRPTVAFWVFIGIPVSFIGTFGLMNLMGVSINMISLFGFIVVLGIVVDDAIVTGESVYSRLRKGKLSGIDAAIKGTHDVALPVTFGVLTTVAAFAPILFLDGARGAVFANIPMVVIPVLLFSLIESKFVLPAHLKHVKLPAKGEASSGLEKFQMNFSEGFENAILRYYRPVLTKAIRHRYSLLMFFIGTFCLLISLLMSGWSKFVFFPRIPSETASASLTMPPGTTSEITERFAMRISDAAEDLQNQYIDPTTERSIITNVLSSIDGNSARVYIETISPEERSLTISVPQLVNEWRKAVGNIESAESLNYRAELGRGGSPIDVQISASNLDMLNTVAEAVREKLSTYEGVFDIEDSLSKGKEELDISLTERGYALGFTRSDIIRQLRSAVFGAEAQRFQRGRDEIRVVLRLPAEERENLSQLLNMEVNTPDGGKIPLSEIATLTSGISPDTITRIDRLRTVNIRGDVEKSKVNMTALYFDLENYMSELATQYSGLRYSLRGEAEEQSKMLRSMLIGAFGALFVIYCLLAIPFKSYSQPAVVMSILPFGVIGAFIGHAVMLLPISIVSLAGMLALIGVMVNDSLVLVDYINKCRLQGYSMYKGVLAAGSRRFRPVILTSLTTFIGLMPMLFEQSTQSQFLKPMAVSLAFGIIFATFITLFMVPANYIILEDVKKLIKKLQTNNFNPKQLLLKK